MANKIETLDFLVSKKILINLCEIEFSLSKYSSVLLVDIGCRTKLSKKSFYISLLIKKDALKNDEVDEIVFEMISMKSDFHLSLSADLSFGNGVYFEQFDKSDLTSEHNENLNDILDFYFSNLEIKIKKMMTEMVI